MTTPREIISERIETYLDEYAGEMSHSSIAELTTDAALLALREAGYEIVPKVPTEKMLYRMAQYTDFVFSEQIPDIKSQAEEMISAWQAALHAYRETTKDGRHPEG